ncbi:MAG: protein-L-isoaspartate(D-aspartate) O-methyltransferase [Elusimicrobia bacterium]|nr:protein-L-isoaspartate(D-aspartate) O-methyltransferase [Elusimicrobiota bacterium]
MKKNLVSEEEWTRIRHTAVARQIMDRGVKDPRVLAAMREVPRHLFLPPKVAPALAYADRALGIGHNQTISQPYIVAFIAEKLNLTGNETVLEVGAGCGYQAAILSKLVKWVVSVELIGELAVFAKQNLERLNITNVEVCQADGFNGWMPSAPYDRIAMTAAASRVPEALVAQLNAPGRLVAPIGNQSKQQLILIEKTPNPLGAPKVTQRDLIPVAFVPMKGEIEK